MPEPTSLRSSNKGSRYARLDRTDLEVFVKHPGKATEIRGLVADMKLVT